MFTPYLHSHTLHGGHTDSVNCVAFCPLGDHLASGGDDCRLVVWNLQTGKAVWVKRLKSPVLSILWDSRRHATIICGCQDGTLLIWPNYYQKSHLAGQSILLGIQAPVYCLDLNVCLDRLAVGVGPEVHIASKLESGQYTTTMILPQPSVCDRASESRVRSRGVHFVENRSQLVVSYLNHGIVCWDLENSTQLWRIEPCHGHHLIGFSSLSPDHRAILISNLSTGMDLYSFGKSQPTRSFRHSIDAARNYPMAVAFLSDGETIVCGAARGDVMLWDVRSGKLKQCLPHADNLVQAVCAGRTHFGQIGYIAAATAQSGVDTHICIWETKLDSKFSTGKAAWYFLQYQFGAGTRDYWDRQNPTFIWLLWLVCFTAYATMYHGDTIKGYSFQMTMNTNPIVSDCWMYGVTFWGKGMTFFRLMTMQLSGYLKKKLRDFLKEIISEAVA